MTHPTTPSSSGSSDDLRTLAQQMLHLTDSEWIKLGVSQDFHQRILRAYFHYVAHADGSSDHSTHPLLVDDLLLEIEQNMTGAVKRLFKLTATIHIEQLSMGQWLMIEDRRLTLNAQREAYLKSRLYQDHTGKVSLHQELPVTDTLSSDDLEPEVLDYPSNQVTVSDQASLTYVDPLDHISSAIGSPFTIRRLDQIVTYLDGVVLPREQVGEQLNIPLIERDPIFDATNRLGLTHQEDAYLKLDFSGVRIARMPRDERLKTLAMMASRLRSEAKLQQTRKDRV